MTAAKTPMDVFRVAPDINAEAWLGATGWASGNQTCAGTMPAFDPNPTSASRKTSEQSSG